MTEIDNRFWEANPQAIAKTLDHVSDQYAVIELKSIDKWTPNTWGCIDKNFSVGYIFAFKCRKEQAVDFCLNM